MLEENTSRSRAPVLVVLFLMAIQPIAIFVIGLLAPEIFTNPSGVLMAAQEVVGDEAAEDHEALESHQRTSNQPSVHRAATEGHHHDGHEAYGSQASLHHGAHQKPGMTHEGETVHTSGGETAAPHSHEHGHTGESELVSWGVAATLLAMIIFVMTMMHFLNSKEKYVRKYTYEALNFTISIFCSVLLFHAMSDLMHDAFGAETHAHSFWVDLVHSIFWFATLELSMAACAGTFGGSDFLDNLNVVQFSELQKNVRCFAILMSHLTGFAAMKTWCSLQQAFPFNQSYLWSSSVVPLAILFHTIAAFGTHRIRHYLQTGDGTDVDHFEELWNEGTADAENDIIGLVLSQLLVNALRFGMSGRLPDDEGQEEGECGGKWCMADHTLTEAGVLQTFAVVCALVASVFFWFAHNESIVESTHSIEGSPQEGPRRSSTHTHESIGPDDSEWTRLQLVTSNVFSMAAAFGTFVGFAYLIAILGEFGKEERMVFLVMLAFVCSGLAAGGILALCLFMRRTFEKGLDNITANMYTRVSQSIVDSLGILVGFSWEQCFGEAVSVLAEDSRSPALIKLLLAIVCTVLLVPAWRYYMLPIVMDGGWRFGFVVNYHWHRETNALEGHLEQVIDHLQAQHRTLKAGHGPGGARGSARLSPSQDIQMAELHGSTRQIHLDVSEPKNSGSIPRASLRAKEASAGGDARDNGTPRHLPRAAPWEAPGTQGPSHQEGGGVGFQLAPLGGVPGALGVRMFDLATSAEPPQMPAPCPLCSATLLGTKHCPYCKGC